MKGRFLLGSSAHKGLQFSAAICMAYKLGHYAGRRYLSFFLPLHVLSGPFHLTLLYTDIESRYHHYDMSDDYQDVFFDVKRVTRTIRCVTKTSDQEAYVRACKQALSQVSCPSQCFEWAWDISTARINEKTASHIKKAIDELSSGRGDWTFDVVAGDIRRNGTTNKSLNVSYPQLEFTLSGGDRGTIARALDEWGLARIFLLLSYDNTLAEPINGGEGQALYSTSKQILWQHNTPSGIKRSQPASQPESGLFASTSRYQ